MNIFCLIAHQNPRSFNYAIAETARQEMLARGHNVYWHDLYVEGFDPILTQEEMDDETKCPELVKQHIRELGDSQGIFIVHPNWWGTPPAIMKGWLDRVLRNGFAYKFTADGPVPMFGDKTIQVISTSNTPRDVEINVYGDPLEGFWKKVVFGLTGYKAFDRRNFESIIMSTPEQRAEWLRETAEIVRTRF